ncbi:MAG: hypothetical protein C7B45_16735 [Sulfobacillus acidophilus]|uniref:Uncharacterized protein n=1 Tax=Sulfobacillus acidophilus TaxID=53633 RepID=A0A2T2WCV2_9FIRM|nr:MAG: hypothetical protein C7B45_16735 [Sulfobacillus acidophilus]
MYENLLVKIRVRVCLVRWSNEAEQCDDRQFLTTGWDRESETGIVAKYRTGQQNRAGKRRAVTSIGSHTKVVSGKVRLAARTSDSPIPIAWTTVAKVDLKNRRRDYEEALCARVARLLPTGCHPIPLADRGVATQRFCWFLHTLGWDWLIRSKGTVWVEWAQQWIPLSLLGKRRPLQLDGSLHYGRKAASGSYASRLVVYADTANAHPWFC